MGTQVLIRPVSSSGFRGSRSADVEGKKRDMKPYLGLCLYFLSYFSLDPNSFHWLAELSAA